MSPPAPRSLHRHDLVHHRSAGEEGEEVAVRHCRPVQSARNEAPLLCQGSPRESHLSALRKGQGDFPEILAGLEVLEKSYFSLCEDIG